MGLLDTLSRLTEADLTTLLRARPDLASPAPADLAELAKRLSAPASVRRVLDGLNVRELAVAEAIASGAAASDLADLLGSPVEAELGVLQQRFLVWSDAVGIHPVAGLRQVFEPYPGGLADVSANPLTDVSAALVDLPDGARAVLEKLMWGPPVGAVRAADRVVTEPVTPIDHLLSRGLLRPLNAETVVIPREVALYLRGGFTREPLGAAPPPPSPGRHSAQVIDSAAVGSAYEFVHEVEGLLDELSRRTPPPLQAGGLAARELTGLAHRAGTSPERAAFALGVGYAADLLTVSPVITATEGFDHWLALGLADRFQALLAAWLRTPRWFAGARALAAEEACWAPALRTEILRHLRPGDLVDVEALVATLAWHRPALAQATDLGERTATVVTEAGRLGLIAFDQASALIAARTELPTEVAAMFPELIDHLIIQSDLTAIATGPLDRPTSAALALLADVESRGGGGVFRFSAASVGRAFDAGWEIDQIEAWLEAHSRTGVPQPLRFLISDVARVHGTVRVGAARAYVRIDDPARLRTVLAHPDAAELGIRQVGPETLVADAEPAEVVALVRRVGLAPAAENAAGEVLMSPRVRRPPAPVRTRARRADPAGVAAALIARRTAAERAGRTDEAISVLTRAMAAGRLIRVDYVDATGSPVSAEFVPLEMAAGRVRLAGDTTVSVPLSRVTAAHWPAN